MKCLDIQVKEIECNPNLNHVNQDNMTIQQFAAEVKKMRDLQKEYFKTRNFDVLKESKDQEKNVDKLVEKITSNQTSIFT